MFGTFHLLMSTLMIIGSLITGWSCRKKTEAQRIRLLFCTGIFLLVLETAKQLFLFFIVEGRTYNWWWFPFQLCSMPMYLCLLLPFLKKQQDTLCTFLSTYILIAALCALVFPQDMLREYVFLTFHGFLWHGLMLVTSFIIIFSRMQGKTWESFFRAVCLFLFLCLIAECINVYGWHHAVNNMYPDMFYISPYTMTYQPLFHEIALNYGKIIEIIVYMISLTAVSACVFLLMKKRYEDHTVIPDQTGIWN